jgi:hypothetical protein
MIKYYLRLLCVYLLKIEINKILCYICNKYSKIFNLSKFHIEQVTWEFSHLFSSLRQTF